MNLYRKYRPQTFKDVVGQEHVKAAIVGQLEAGDAAHAYVFSGPRGVGKTTIARLIAKSLNCTERAHGSAEPCGTCQSCVAITEGRAMDVMEIDAASHTSVEHVREHILERVRVAPMHQKHTVFIIDEAHMLSKSAFNALLKTLEEPPAHVVFMLATTELHKIPDTIVSRCQRYQFFMLSPEVMMKRLKGMCEAEGKRVDDDVLREVAYRSGGSQRDAESLLDQLLHLEQSHITRERAVTVIPMTDLGQVKAFLEGWAQRRPQTSIQTLQSVMEGGTDLNGFTARVLEVLRGVLLHRLGAISESMAYTHVQFEDFASVLKEVSDARLTDMLEAAQVAATAPAHEALPQLPLELATIRVCGDGDTVTPPVAPSASAVHFMETIEDSTTVAVSDEDNASAQAGVGSVAAIALEDVKSRWSTFQSKLRKKHASLPLAMELAEPISVDGCAIAIRVPFAFYAETVNAGQNNRLLSTLMSEVLGSTVSIKAVYETSGNAVVDSVVDAFGGVVQE
ncbi:DNA polymerase III, subunit gamma and tau [Candidatus Uhrbacteria bacterium RIFCSPHIGHO2_02_FULL_53_13]|uniref:DNA polymerase III subunit gamma/tau n=2 Tax=Candidatus Uhriibacteriota TaxID=1752732 RepID=A0A1F7TXP4_9BACT|nr:MAG: DNA polymerase III, subunit gamma and tau [Candidatus Uhrbacteria bacterium RIFCSPHIGHO2_02_FULL_53_13]OGL88987.1 MAG: DNA polymerase III, subunit gamma and tau [Candidatus Uhrbacteria bacterium RIFCSPLOWO2_02_FULL_53_10]